MRTKPKLLWVAKLDFRQPGRWLATEEFYLGKPYKPEIPMKYRCHVLYETPMEAFIALYKEISTIYKKQTPFNLPVYIYSTKPQLITDANYFGPDKLKDLEVFAEDRDLLTRHLIRQSLTFHRAGNLSISYNRFDKTPLLDLAFVDKLGKEKHLMTIRKPTVTLTYGVWAKHMCNTVEEALFNFDNYPFPTPVSFKPHVKKVLEKV